MKDCPRIGSSCDFEAIVTILSTVATNVSAFTERAKSTSPVRPEAPPLPVDA